MGPSPHEFKVLLYGPGLAAAGVATRAWFVGERLRLATANEPLDVAAENLDLRVGGYDGRQWQLTWTDAAGPHAATLPDAATVQDLLRLAPASLRPRLQAAQAQQAGINRRFGLALGFLALLLGLLVVGLGLLYANKDRLSRWATDQISLEQERQLGDFAFARMRPSLQLLEQGAAVTAVNEIGQRLTATSPYPYRFHVAVDPEVNAFALPGGHIVVYTGLLKAADDGEEVAGVLAHEISHVALRHSLRGLVHDLGLRAVLAVFLGDFSGGLWGDLAAQLGELHYSRALESEADRAGLDRLLRAGIDPRGMARFFAKMAARPEGVPEFLSSHPAGDERLSALRQAISARPLPPALTLDIDWKRLRAEL